MLGGRGLKQSVCPAVSNSAQGYQGLSAAARRAGAGAQWPSFATTISRSQRRAASLAGQACDYDRHLRIIRRGMRPSGILQDADVDPPERVNAQPLLGTELAERGTRYGTIVAGLERRKVIDVLNDRAAATMTSSLQAIQPSRLSTEIGVTSTLGQHAKARDRQQISDPSWFRICGSPSRSN
jgi:hypothetical protein